MFFVLHFLSEKQLVLVKMCTAFFCIREKMRTKSIGSHLYICCNFVDVNFFKRNTLFNHQLYFHVFK